MHRLFCGAGMTIVRMANSARGVIFAMRVRSIVKNDSPEGSETHPTKVVLHPARNNTELPEDRIRQITHRNSTYADFE